MSILTKDAIMCIPYVSSVCVSSEMYHTILQNKRMRRCGMHPPSIILERLKLPQKILYRRKGNLSESPNHFNNIRPWGGGKGLRGPDDQTHSCQSETQTHSCQSEISYSMMPKLGDFKFLCSRHVFTKS